MPLSFLDGESVHPDEVVEINQFFIVLFELGFLHQLVEAFGEPSIELKLLFHCQLFFTFYCVQLTA